MKKIVFLMMAWMGALMVQAEDTTPNMPKINAHVLFMMQKFGL